MQERKSSIKNFIGIYDGYIPNEACDQAIELFNKYQEFNKVFSRFSSEGTTQDRKDDKQLFCSPDVLTDEEFSVNKLKTLMVYSSYPGIYGSLHPIYHINLLNSLNFVDTCQKFCVWMYTALFFFLFS